MIILMMGQSLFAKTFGGTDDDCAYSISQTTDGGYVVAGYTYSFGAGNCDFLVLKLDPDGSIEWARTFGGWTVDWAYSIAQTSDGGYAVVGGTYSFGAGLDDFLVLKLDPDGSIEWARTFGGKSGECDYNYTCSIIQTNDAGYAVAGLTHSFGAGQDDFLVFKLDTDGSLAWARTFGGTDDDCAYSISQTTDGGYVVAGSTESFGVGSTNFLILKLDPSGNLSWAKTFGGVSRHEARSIIQTSDSGYAVTGWIYGFGAGSSDFLVLKLDPDGSIEWARTFGGTGWDESVSVIQTVDGGYAVTGLTHSFSVGWGDFLVLKLDPDGSLEWAKTFGGTSYDYVYSIIQTTDGGYAVAGRTRSFGTGLDDLLVLKLGADGDYSGCVQPCLPMVTSPNPSISSPSPTQTSPSLSISIPNLTITTPNLTMTDVCPPAVGEADIPGPRPGITCSPISGGAFFLSPGEMFLKVYTANGRLVYSEALRKGENKITLERGVYLWHAGPYKGKVIIR